MKIRRSLVGSEYHNTYYHRDFKVLDKLPEIGEEYDGGIVIDIHEFRNTEFTGEDRAYDDGYYDYYRLNIKYYPGEEDEFEDEQYVAIWREYDFDEEDEEDN
jgi:hypothetical protein